MSFDVEDYRGLHTAPDASNGAPLYDLTSIYPEDIYTSVGARYYGHQEDPALDHACIQIIQAVHHRPQAQVKVYRAVPKRLTIAETVTLYQQHKTYMLKQGKLPKGVTGYPNYSAYYNFITQELVRLAHTPETTTKIYLNEGDWVTIVKGYAVAHGQAHLQNNYRIVSKTVLAKHLYTDGNSIFEYGYSTQ